MFSRCISTQYLFIHFKTNIAAQSCGHRCCHTLPIPIHDGAADFKTQTASASINVFCYDKLPMTLSHSNFYFPVLYICGPGSSVGIATGYGLNGPGIESRWEARFSAPVQSGPGALPASFTMGTGAFSGVKSGRGVSLIPHFLLVPWS